MSTSMQEPRALTRIHQLLETATPEATAFTDYDGRKYSYAQMQALSQQVAEALARHGVRPGDRVMVLSENSVSFVALVMGLSRIGAWALLVNARLTEGEVDRLAQVADIRAAVFTPEASPAAAAHAARMDAVELAPLECGALLATPTHCAEAEPPEDGADHVAALIYTSGTVGEPKGVMLTHDNLLFMAQAAADLRKITPEDVMLAVLPGTHIFGLTSVFLAPLSRDARLILMPRFDPDQVLEHIREEATVMPAVPQIFAALLKRLRETGVARPAHKLRFIYAGGAPLDMTLKKNTEEAFGIVLHNGYGQTEAAPGIANTRLDLPRQDASVGLPIPGVEVVIHAPDANGIGELWVRGRNVMKGYYRNLKATAETITPEGFLRTSDLARQDPDGALHIVGRLKELIVHSGFNVYPPEVEAVLAEHPAVTLSAVVGRARDGNEEVLGFVTTHMPVTEAELRAYVQGRIAGYKVPARIIIADELPQAATGKILKAKLLDHFRAALD